MDKPRIFLGSSGKQEKLLQALTRGLADVAHVEPWTTSFNPGTTTLERLLELAHEVDFAAFVFARDDWTVFVPVHVQRNTTRSPSRLISSILTTMSGKALMNPCALAVIAVRPTAGASSLTFSDPCSA